MAVKYVEFKSYKRPIGRNCMHCGRPAYHTAVQRNARFRMNVRFCDEHVAVAHDINARRST